MLVFAYRMKRVLNAKKKGRSQSSEGGMKSHRRGKRVRISGCRSIVINRRKRRVVRKEH